MAAGPPSGFQTGPHGAGERAFEEKLRQSTVVDWVYGGVICLGSALLGLILTMPHAYSAPHIGAVICFALVVAASILRKLDIGRSSTGIAGFVLTTYALVVLFAHHNGIGIRTPALNIGPVLLFMVACLAPVRVAVSVALGALLLVLSLVPSSPPIQVAHVPSQIAVAFSAVLSLLLGGILGIGIGRILRQTVAASVTLAHQHYQQVFSEQTHRTLRAVLEASPYGIVLSELPGGHIRLFNAAFARIMGGSEQETKGRSPDTLGAWTGPEQWARILNRVRQGEVFDELLEIRQTTGNTLPLQATAISLELDGVQHLMLMGRDISQEQRRQLELQAVMDTAEAAIMVIQRGSLVGVSRHFEQLMGIERSQALGQATALNVGGAQSLQALHELHALAPCSGEVVRMEHTIYRPDGSTFEGRLTTRLIHPGMRDGLSTVVLIEDITDQKRHEQQLEKSRENAVAASRAKSEFLARMSHELRTPLNGILGLAELAADPRGDEATRQVHLHLMLESGRGMAQLLSDILDISKIEAGRLELQPEVFELGPWLERIRASFVWGVESKGLRLLVQASDGALGWVRADPVRLRQILVNYLANALKFTFQGEIILALSRPDPHRLRIEVRDTGMGIPQESQPKLFRPFEQLLQGVQQEDSTGLGLVICKELAQRMNGRVGLNSTVGEGSTFWAEVAVEPAFAPATGTAAADPPSGIDQLPLQGLHILLADDNRVNQVVGVRMLERAGALVKSAVNGQEAVEAVQRAHAAGEPFDAVLMDVQMPVMDGVEATRIIRSLPEGQRLLIVAATAAALQEELNEALSHGMDAALTKPYDFVKLVATIQQAMLVRSSAQLPH